MGHQVAYLAAVDGKHRGNKSNTSNDAFVMVRRLLMAAAVLFAGSLYRRSPRHAQSGAFAGMAGNWAGGGTVTLDDGSKERIRCRATYAVAGANMTMTLTCASRRLQVPALGQCRRPNGGAVTGTWSEASRNISGTLQGRGGGGSFQVVASTAGFNANISLRTAGNKQSISMRGRQPVPRGRDLVVEIAGPNGHWITTNKKAAQRGGLCSSSAVKRDRLT